MARHRGRRAGSQSWDVNSALARDIVPASGVSFADQICLRRQAHAHTCSSRSLSQRKVLLCATDIDTWPQ